MSMIGEQVKELREFCSGRKLDLFSYDEVNGVLLQAADTIEALSAKLAKENMERSERYYNGGWILCRERLPVGDNFRKRFDGEYYYKHLLVSVNEEETPIYIAYYDQESEQWSDLDGFHITPIAWQPLPEPYKPL